jgi:enoyl-CoA hydratase/long-chain 3-hydroxyacyl-CoA dehydrogenase
VPLDKLDAAIKEYGYPVGPITLADEVRSLLVRWTMLAALFVARIDHTQHNHNTNQVGVDVAAHVQAFLSKADLGVRMTGADGAVLDAVRR